MAASLASSHHAARRAASSASPAAAAARSVQPQPAGQRAGVGAAPPPPARWQQQGAARRHTLTCAAAAVAANSCNGSTPSSSGAADRPSPPSSAETARTVVDLVAHGTLCTTGEDGIPLGTYASYVLDGDGQPVLRLRADAVHTANLRRSPACSLFVQPGEHPARLLARVTLIGRVEPVAEDVAAKAADLHAAMHVGGMGVDAPRPTDLYYSLKVDSAFYVGELAGASQAEVIAGDDYRAAEADPLRTCAAALVQHMNTNRAEDVLRISCDLLGEALEDMFYAEMLWVDRGGAYLRAVSQEGDARTMRLPFLHAVDDERDARSQLTMLAQLAWERERTWNPVLATVNLTPGEAMPGEPSDN
eukprot:scaffold20.g7645.t1